MAKQNVGWTLVLAAGLIAGADTAKGQGRDDAVLVVEGLVREVFRSDSAGSLVQIDVRRSELGKGRPGGGRLVVPAPGDVVYVHAPRAVPSAGAEVRAYLAPRPTGGWEAASADWFNAGTDAPASRPVPVPEPKPDGARASFANLGVTGEGRTVDGRYVLKVTGVERGGPGQKAGLEVGDVIVAVNEKEAVGPGPFAEAIAKGGALTLVVLDINTGKGVRVAVQAPAADAPGGDVATAPAPAPAPAPAGPRRSLGVSAEPVQVGQRTAMRVVRVDPESPAQRAGLEVGDLIVEANGVAVTGVEPLGAALRTSGPVRNLTVRDSRTGRDTPVKVDLGGGDAPPQAPAPPTSPAAPGATTGTDLALGAVTEVVFLDNDSAVKVTEVSPGSAAQRAGLKPGDIITEANGTPILHPNTLNEEVRKGGAVLKLTVVDPRSGRRSRVEVPLGKR